MTTDFQPTIGFIGAGRVAQTLARACAAAGYRVAAVASRSTDSAARLAAVVPGCRAVENGQAVVDTVDLVLLTVPDDVIETVAQGLRWRSGMAAVHCSGATDVAALSSAAAAGAYTGGFHPLQAFTDPAIALTELSGCSVAIEAEPPLRDWLETLAAALGMRSFRLAPGVRALYHLSGSFAASFIDALLHEAVMLWESFGIPRVQALEALLPLAQGTLDSVAALGTAKALTGPISRGDVGTVTRHLDALRTQQPATLPLYALLAQRSLLMAAEAGRLEAGQQQALQALIEQALTDSRNIRD